MKTWIHRVEVNGLEIGFEWRCWSITALVSLPRFYLERSEGGNIVWSNFRRIDQDTGMFEACAGPMLTPSARLDAPQQSTITGRASDEIVAQEMRQ